jgi:phage terminase large subunit
MTKVIQKVNSKYRGLFQPGQGVRYIILMGGRGAGRSTVVSQLLTAKLLAPEYLRAAIMRFVLSDIRNSCFREIKDRLVEQSIESLVGVNESNMSFKYGTNEIVAHGFRKSSGDQSAKLKSLANYNIVWIEEADEVMEEDFMQLDDSLRTVKGNIYVVLSLNPPSRSHWIIKRFFDLEPSEEPGFYIPKCSQQNVLYIRTDYTDNAANLDSQTLERYEMYRRTNPAYYWNMIKGYVPEVVMGRIYSNWREMAEIPHEARLLGYGLDFGFNPDPDAITAIYYHNGGYILDEKLYQTGNTPEQLASVLKMLYPAPIIADSADNRMIATLRGLGLNIIETDKGPGSVEWGIRHVQSLKISYTTQSTNLKREYENYAWLRTKDGDEKSVPNPQCPDHLLDSARYFLTKMIKANADPDALERQMMINQEQEQRMVQTTSARLGL